MPLPLPLSRLVIRDAGRYVVGVLLLLGVVFLWTASNFITANLETGEDSWNKPFLITYFNTASFTVYLLPTLWRHWRSRSLSHSALQSSRQAHAHHSGYEGDHLSHLISHAETRAARRPSSLARDDTLSVSRLSRRSTSQTRSMSIPSSPRVSVAMHPPRDSLDLERIASNQPILEEEGQVSVEVDVLSRLSIRETAEIAAWWSVVWFVANWAVNASLAWTSVASVTVLSSTSGFFTLALGRICGVEDLTRTKVFAVVASFLGVLLVTRSDSSLATDTAAIVLTDASPSHPIFGDTLALLSAACYAVYVILLKVRVVDEDRADMQLMLGFAGLFNTIFLIPIFPILHYLGWETFELPPNKEAWIICLVNFCITLSSDYLYVLAMLKTTPMLVTIGLSLTIPLALVGSLVIPSSSTEGITSSSLLGAGLVFVGFGILGWQGYIESSDHAEVFVVEEQEQEQEEQQQEREGLLPPPLWQGQEERGRSVS